MQVYSLGLDDFCEDDYSLIGIHTTLEDYKLVYLLNKELNTGFKKADFNLDFDDTKASFSIYSYTNDKYDFDWYLIANSTTDEKQIPSNRLLLYTETKTYLIPEKKNIDFFIKISGEKDYDFVSKTVQKIKEIHQVITSYQIDKNTLKSKDFLIF